MGPRERRAVLSLLTLAVVGHGIRLLGGPGPAAPGAVVLLGADSAASAARHRDSAAGAGRPLSLGERIDVDRAGAAELMRLPGVGAGLARAIVEDRSRAGPFGSLAGLGRVRGIGARTLARLEPYVGFSAPGGPPGSFPAPGGSPTRLDLNQADSAALDRLPGIGPSLARKVLVQRAQLGGFRTVEDLLGVPGIGPATLERLRPLVEVR